MLDNLVVIKLSGKALEHEERLIELFAAVKNLNAIIVHGGGVEVDDLLAKLSINTEKIDGIRVSNATAMPYIVAGLAGICNKKLQAIAIKANCKALGLICTDGNTLKLRPYDQKYGFVASSQGNDKAFVSALLEQKILPIICSVGIDDNGITYNVNADDVASSLANLFKCPIYFISDVIGVLDKNKELIESLDNKKIEQLILDKTITEGMIAKVKYALEASYQCANNVYICSINDPQLCTSISRLRRLGTAFC